MKVRIWRGCRVVAELEFAEDGCVTVLTGGHGSLVGDDDHVSIDPWSKHAGEHRNEGERSRSRSVYIGLPE